MAVTINLYPPIVDSVMPAFLINNSVAAKNICRVYFSLSLYNTEDEIKNCQVVVRNLKTNLSALNSDKYPSEIMLTELKKDNNKQTDDRYYIEIKPTDMVNNNFIIDQFYKVQIRFTSTDAADPVYSNPNVQDISTWLEQNKLYFSEWSTVCLIKGISTPILSLQTFEAGTIVDIYNTIADIQVLGKLNFSNENETETMKSYQVILYNSNEQELLDSGNIYTSNFSNKNEINYTFNYSFESNNSYHFDFTYLTQSLYSETITFYFYIQQGSTEPLQMSLNAQSDIENGRVEISVIKTEETPQYTGEIIIKRTDNKSNFTVWEDLYTEIYQDVLTINIDWYDYTIESGVWYKYGIQGVDTQGVRTPTQVYEQPIMMLLDDMYLTGEDRQLKIKFNPQVSTFQKVIKENKIDTIGSMYPFIKRNGDVYYSSFPVSGLISCMMDENNIFTSKDKLYKDALTYFNNYNTENEIVNYQDFIFEKYFRDEVIKFLYNKKAKLFRSPSEGNILVKLTGISLTPNQTLGRRIWTFTAQAHEIDECTIDNYDKYEIFTRVKPDISVIDKDSKLIPIQRVIFIDDERDFPVEGREYFLYVFENQLYIWDAENEEYLIVSVPEWNTEVKTLVLKKHSESEEGVYLYVYEKQVYIWDSDSQLYKTISVPEWNRDDTPTQLQPVVNSHDKLYVNAYDIYEWNDDTSVYNTISVPLENQEFYEGGS